MSSGSITASRSIRSSSKPKRSVAPSEPSLNRSRIQKRHAQGWRLSTASLNRYRLSFFENREAVGARPGWLTRCSAHLP